MANKRNIFGEEKGYIVGALFVTLCQLYIKRHWRLDRMYGKRDKRQIKSNIKLDQQDELEFSRDSERRAHAEMLWKEHLEFRHEQNREHCCRGRAALTIEQMELRHNPLKLTQDELNEINDMLGRPCSKNPSIFELNAGVNSEHELQASRGHQAHAEMTSNQLDISQERLMSNICQCRQCQQARHRHQQQAIREFRQEQIQLQHRITHDELNPEQLESHEDCQTQAHDELTPEPLVVRQQQDRDRLSFMERYYGL